MILVYAALTQLQRQLGFEAYTNAREKDLIAEIFDPTSVEISVLSETFCNFEEMKFESFIGPLEVLITDPHFRTGRLINFYPMVTNGKGKGGFT